MSENIPQPQPDLPPLSYEDRIDVQLAQTVREQSETFKATLDPEEQTAFEEIFGPIGQIALEEAYEQTGYRRITQFGLFPKDATPKQNSIYALMAADKEERIGMKVPEGSPEREAYLKEAARLRAIARGPDIKQL
jgi:hypothetical protein